MGNINNTLWTGSPILNALSENYNDMKIQNDNSSCQKNSNCKYNDNDDADWYEKKKE